MEWKASEIQVIPGKTTCGKSEQGVLIKLNHSELPTDSPSQGIRKSQPTCMLINRPP